MSFYAHGIRFSARIEFDTTVPELHDASPRAPHPTCGVELKPHQLALLQRCTEYEASALSLRDFPSLGANVNPDSHMRTQVAVMGDRVGAGKSFVILALVQTHDITGVDTPLFTSAGLNRVTFTTRDTTRVVRTNAIVIPHNLAAQWDGYVRQYGAIDRYRLVNKAKILRELMEDPAAVEDLDLVVITTTYFRTLLAKFVARNVKFQRVVFDECDSISLTGCAVVPANFVWAVTASYGNLLYPRGHNRYDPELGRHVWSAEGIHTTGFVRNFFNDIDYRLPLDLARLLVVKNADAFVDASMSLPAVQTNVVRCRTPVTISVLNGVVDKNVIASLNAGDTQAAINLINPANRGDQSNIIAMLVERLQRQRVNLDLQLTMTSSMIFDDEAARDAELENVRKKIRDVDDKIAHIRERVQHNNLCNICLETVAEHQTVTRCCQNTFCFTCIHMWLDRGRAVCPMCKGVMRQQDLLVVCPSGDASGTEAADTTDTMEVDGEGPSDDDVHPSFEKTKNLEILLRRRRAETPGSKTLIFSAHDFSFGAVEPVLDRLGLRYATIRGNGTQIQATVRRYRGSELDVLLVNARNFGSGMNLETTTDVVMFHRLNSQVEGQVIGRAQRTGRTEALRVHYLLHENEISAVAAAVGQ